MGRSAVLLHGVPWAKQLCWWRIIGGCLEEPHCQSNTYWQSGGLGWDYIGCITLLDSKPSHPNRWRSLKISMSTRYTWHVTIWCANWWSPGHPGPPMAALIVHRLISHQLSTILALQPVTHPTTPGLPWLLNIDWMDWAWSNDPATKKPHTTDPTSGFWLRHAWRIIHRVYYEHQPAFANMAMSQY